MRPGTAVALVGVVGVLVAAGVYGYAAADGGGALAEVWISDTPRDNRVNHHAVGVGPDGRVVVAPVAAVAGAEEITETSCSLVRLAPADGAVVWRASVDPKRCFSHALTEPAVADVDSDGALEVVAATTEDALVVLDAASGSEEFRVSLGTYGYGRPTVANLTADPGPEIVASDIRGGVVVVRGDRGVAWRTRLNETVWAAPAVVDVDADGAPEVVVAGVHTTAALAADGTADWRVEATGATMTTAQADDDPALEVFVTDTGLVAALDGKRGAVEWRYTTRGNPTVHAVGDGDGDGAVEVYVGVSPGRAVALDAATGREEWTTTLLTGDRAAMPPLALGDLDGDGAPELVAVTNDGTVSVLDPGTGQELAAYEREVLVWTFPTLADIDGDGGEEILVRYGDGRVVALEFTR